MNDILDALKGMQTSTLIIMGFAAVLLILLLVLIIVTIKVLKSSNYEEEEDDKKEDDKEKEKELSQNSLAEEAGDFDDDDDDFEDEMSRRIREAVESVEETKAKVEAQKIEEERQASEKSEDEKARETAAARVQKIAAAVSGETDEDQDDSDDSYDDDDDESGEEITWMGGSDSAEKTADDTDASDDEFDEDDSDIGNVTDELEIKESTNKELTEETAAAKTAVVDTVKIKEELRKARKEAKESARENRAKERAEAPEYSASFDSAFVEKPVFEEEKEAPVIPNPTPESMIAAAEADAAKAAMATQNKITVNPVNVIEPTSKENLMQVKEFLEENPTPVSKKRKSKKKGKNAAPVAAAPVRTSKYYWYNTQDVDGLTRKEDMYFRCHYFDNGDDIILDLITEMYDCAFVRTEELQRIAYGITFKSLNMKDILRSDDDLSFDKDKAVKEPSESDRQEAYEKWCQYVDRFLEIIEINAPEEVKEYIVNKMYEYGHKDIEELMHSPY